MLVVVGVAALGWTLSWIDPRRIVAVALRAHPAWLAASLAATVVRFLIWGVKWRRMLERDSPVPYRLAMSTLMAGTFINVTTPTAKIAGGVLRAMVLHRERAWSRLAAYGWVLADQMSNVCGTLMFASVAALAFGAGGTAGVATRPLIASGVLGLVGVGTVLALRAPAWAWVARPAFESRLARLVPERFRDRHQGHAGWVRRVVRPLLGPGPAAFRPLPDIAFSATSFGALCLSNALALWALDADVGLGTVTVTVVIAYFAGMGVGAWGGLGVTEATLTALYMRAGVGPETAAAGVLLHRAGYFLTVLVWGGAAVVRHGRAVSGDDRDDQREKSSGPAEEGELPSPRPPGV